MNRRDYLTLAGAAAALVAGTGCGRVGQRVVKARESADSGGQSPAEPAGSSLSTNHSPLTTDSPSAVVRLLNRAAYGPAPGDLNRLASMGHAAWVEEQLRAPKSTGVPSLIGLGLGALTGGKNGDDAGGETPGLLYRLAGIEPLHFSTYEQRDWPEARIREALTQAALLRAVYSKWQLRERMVAFWGDHFNIYGPKVIDFGEAYATTHLTYYLNTDQGDVVRTHALGRFPDLLQASARSPAMLGYLDNQRSMNGTANENYAREIMELHTLGVGGGYSQKDVQEVARCLTGWGVEERFYQKRGTFRFVPEKHDNGAKTVLGETIPAGGGIKDGETVLAILAKHPSTARFISRKLVRHFRGDEDEATWVDRLTIIYTKTGGDIAAMLRPLLLADDLAAAPPILKRPWDYVVSALRATNADTDAGADVQGYLRNIGQPLFEWPMPDGYPEKTASWTGSLLARWNFAFALTAGQIEQTTLPEEFTKMKDRKALATTVMGAPPDATVAKAISAAKSGAEAMALALCAPGFQWR
ncbi:MAG: DUF1800 domain-containing protein [Fibrella sp.]|nr:DUF1800 domain-containing protein [Armatimonadota bacterium]